MLMLMTGCTQPTSSGTSPPSTALSTDSVQRLATASVGLDPHTQGHMLQDVTQTINGITVTVHWTYADTERVLVGYTIQGPGDVIYEPRQVLLTTTDGQVFPEQGGSGVVGSDELLGITAPRNFGAFLPQFG